MGGSFVKYVRIVWRDATSVDEWTDIKDIEPECHEIETVGILLYENKELITIALNHDPKGEAYSCYITIPKAWIKDIKELRVKKN